MNAELAAIVFGLAAAVSWGAGDFSGGAASKYSPVHAVILLSQVVGLVMLTLFALIAGESVPTLSTLSLGGLAGLAGLAGLVALYRALATNPMGLVAPLTAVVAAGLPVVVGIAVEGLPGALQFLGFVAAFAAVWLIARDGRGDVLTLRQLDLPIIAGIGFGLFFILIDRASDEAVYWPLVAARTASIGTLLVLTVFGRRSVSVRRAQLPIIFITGVLEAGGNAFFALAAAAGRLDIASVLASLYPAATVILAWIVLKEHLSSRQWIGVAAALVAVVLIAV